MLECLIITVCLVLVIDWFNAPNEILSQLMGKRVTLKKPFGCSACMSFWVTLIVLLFISPELCWLSLGYAFASKYIFYFIEVVDKTITKVFILIERLLK